jgi:hypothetical protein
MARTSSLNRLVTARGFVRIFLLQSVFFRGRGIKEWPQDRVRGVSQRSFLGEAGTVRLAFLVSGSSPRKQWVQVGPPVSALTSASRSHWITPVIQCDREAS